MIGTEISEISQVYGTPIMMLSGPHFYLVILVIVCSIWAFDVFTAALKDIYSEETKEKSLRKLMKALPKRKND